MKPQASFMNVEQYRNGNGNSNNKQKQQQHIGTETKTETATATPNRNSNSNSTMCCIPFSSMESFDIFHLCSSILQHLLLLMHFEF